MDTSNNDLKSENQIKLLAYQAVDGKDAPLASEELPSTPTPPPSVALHMPPDTAHDDSNQSAHKSNSLLDVSSRPKPVRGTTRVLSSLYAKLLVASSAILITTEVLPNSVPLFFFHGYLFTFLFGAAVVCFLCIYMSLILQKCPGMEELEELSDSTHQCESVLQRKAYCVPEISIFFRVGALVFGLGTLIAIGLEVATLFTAEKSCVDDLNFVQPIIHALFTFMQMHFLSLNSQKAIRYLGWCRHIVLMHLMATNIVVWLRLIVWESAKSWLDDIHTNVNVSERFPPDGFEVTAHSINFDGRHDVYVSPNCVWMRQEKKMEDILHLQQCYQNTTIGLVWNKAQPFILPFIVQFCLVGVAVTYSLWASFPMRRISRKSNSWSPRHRDADSTSPEKTQKVDCKGSSKGLFLGLLVLAVGIVVLILFFVLTNNPNLKEETLFIMITVHCAILGVSFLGILLAVCRVGSMCTDYTKSQNLHTFLQNIGVFAVYVHGVCSLVVGSSQMANVRYLILFVDGALMIGQSLAQSVLFHKLSQKCCSTKCKHEDTRPGRQVVTFLAFTNLVLWVTESFTNHDHISSQLQLHFFGFIPWDMLSRVLLPIVMFYRFHSSVYLMEMWKSGYCMDS